MITIAFFSNKGGVGNTSLVYHLAWMFCELGLKVVAVDLDPQADLTTLFLDEERWEELWPTGNHPLTIQGVVDPILQGVGDIKDPHIEKITDGLFLLPGDLGLSNFEDKLAQAWPFCHQQNEAAFRTTTSFYRAALLASDSLGADIVLLDTGPNLGAINRAALIASNYVVIPLASDLFSLQALRNLGPQLRSWRQSWEDLTIRNPDPQLPHPNGEMEPLGYILLAHAIRSHRPFRAYRRWMEKLPGEYRVSILNQPAAQNNDVESDPECLAILKQYRSLMPLAIEARKPMFFLKPADGALGAHGEAVRDCYRDFKKLAAGIAMKCTIPLPSRNLVSF